MQNNTKKEILDWLKSFFTALVVVFIIKFFLFDIVPIENISMQPTLYSNDRVFVNIIEYKLSKPKHFDVIILKAPNEKDIYYVKRIIALPGDHLIIKNGKVFLNNTEINESYLKEGIFTEGNIDMIIPEDNLFVLGDNRINSKDSREFGIIPISSVKGHAQYILYPFDKIKRI